MFDAIKKFIGTKNDREIKKLQPIVVQINSMEERFKAMSDEELRGMTPKFRELLDKGKSLDEILPAAFAVVREAGRRTMGMRHYDVQLIGGMFLHKGCIAEMRTGEGKTLVATLPLYLNALQGKGAHLVTVNDYLASRDADWMGQIYRFLGMSVGTIINDLNDFDRQKAYRSDITYGTNNEFGFDYLRDNMKFTLDRKVLRDLHYAIVDEVDSILVDEARTPLIISGSADQSTEMYFEINKIVPTLRKDEDYTVNEESHSVVLTDEGVQKVEKRLGITNLYDPSNIEYTHHVTKALQAHTLYKKDVHYIVDNGEVIIVDEHTGRPMQGRRWSDGLHQAVEAKEEVQIREENQTLATITFQNFFRMYKKLGGMTGTAATEAEEFKEIYNLEVREIPTHRPVQRRDQNDVIYRTEKEKFKAIVDQILVCHEKGQPVLVGTVSVEKSEAISKVLRRKDIEHTVLNAKYHRKEAEIVAQAGRKGGITIATNMAGRGTDILLGGNAEARARDEVGNDTSEEYKAALARYKVQCKAEREEVLKAGGLFILGTERHESRRIDNQLRGRAGRQGDPGESRFFLSLEDDLMRIFGGERLSFIMEKLDMPEGEPIESGMVTKSIENAQRRVEGRNFDMRKSLLEYDDVMNQQRKTIYALRDKVLGGGDGLYNLVLDAFDRVASSQVEAHCPEKVKPSEWNVEALREALRTTFDLDIEVPRTDKPAVINKTVWTAIEKHIKGKEADFNFIASEANERYKGAPDYKVFEGREAFLELCQQVYLRAIDHRWREHLKGMAALRDAIRFQGYAQKDPRKIYKIEGFEAFVKAMSEIDHTVVEHMSKVELDRETHIAQAMPRSMKLQAQRPAAPPPRPQVAAAPAAAAAMPVALADLEAPKPKIRSLNPSLGAEYAAPSTPAPQSLPQPQELPQAQALHDAGGFPEPAELGSPESEAHAGGQDVRVLRKIGRNDPCPCGSGQKFKHCHMGKELELEALLASRAPAQAEEQAQTDEPAQAEEQAQTDEPAPTDET